MSVGKQSDDFTTFAQLWAYLTEVLGHDAVEVEPAPADADAVVGRITTDDAYLASELEAAGFDVERTDDGVDVLDHDGQSDFTRYLGGDGR